PVARAAAAIAILTPVIVARATAVGIATGAASSATSGPLLTRLCLAHAKRPVVEGRPVEGCDGCMRGVFGHLDEAKALALAAVAVHHDRSLTDIAIGAKNLSKLLITNSVGQVAHVNSGGHVAPPSSISIKHVDVHLRDDPRSHLCRPTPGVGSNTPQQVNPCGVRRLSGVLC